MHRSNIGLRRPGAVSNRVRPIASGCASTAAGDSALRALVERLVDAARCAVEPRRRNRYGIIERSSARRARNSPASPGGTPWSSKSLIQSRKCRSAVVSRSDRIRVIRSPAANAVSSAICRSNIASSTMSPRSPEIGSQHPHAGARASEAQARSHRRSTEAGSAGSETILPELALADSILAPMRPQARHTARALIPPPGSLRSFR